MANHHFTLAFGPVPAPGWRRLSSMLFVSPGTGSPLVEAVSVEAQPLKAQIAAVRRAKIDKYFMRAEPNQRRIFLHKKSQPANDCWPSGNAVAFVVTTISKIDIKSLQLPELENKVRELEGPLYRAKQIADWLYQRRVESFEAMTDLSREFRSRLAQEFTFSKIDIVRVLGSRDTTRKFLFRLTDGNLIESVLIPASPALYGSRSDRRTICVSTQVGCAYGCKFCASGLEGFSRNLKPNEILDQIIAVEGESGEKIDNIVFMGMGEPLANFENLMRAIRIINASWGLGIGARHITLSTSGLAPQIRRLADEPLQIRLAISLHGATDQVRNQIMPINRRYNLDKLLEACDYYAKQKKQRLTFEYILISDVNDSPEQARRLGKIARRLGAKVNLIPYNTVHGLPWSRPSPEQQAQFLSILRAGGVAATLRREKGHDIDAACGQLRLQTKRELESAPS
jgi:23S rRNA (adenine2503-C2)-methyltransferase